MKVLLSGVAMAALLTWGLPAWSQTHQSTAPQTRARLGAGLSNEPGYDFPHPTADADDVTVRAMAKHDGMSKPDPAGPPVPGFRTAQRSRANLVTGPILATPGGVVNMDEGD